MLGGPADNANSNSFDIASVNNRAGVGGASSFSNTATDWNVGGGHRGTYLEMGNSYPDHVSDNRSAKWQSDFGDR